MARPSRTASGERPLEEEVRAFFGGDPAIQADPYPFFDRLRAESPVRSDGHALVVSSHAAVRQVQTDTVHLKASKAEDEGYLALLSEEEKGLFREIVEFENLYMSSRNGDHHTRIRRVAQGAFTPRQINALAESVQSTLEELLEPVLELEQSNFMDLAYQLPLLVIMDVLGVPRADAALLKQWGDELNARRSWRPVPAQILRDAHAGMTAYRAYVEDLVERQEDSAASELMAVLIEAGRDRRISLDELVAMIVHLTFAGHETTTNLFGNGIHALLSNRDQWELLCEDEARVQPAVEELLRFDAPVQLGRRVAATKFELEGVTVVADQVVVPMLGAANHDPAVFNEPHRLDISRRPNDHMSLGVGAHFCMGGPLARLEGRTVFATLARRFPAMELTGPPTRGNHPSLRGFTDLPVAYNTI